MAAADVRILGGFEARVRSTGALIELPTRKCEALLAYMALEPGRLVRRDLLVSLLWADVPRNQGRHSLRQTLTRLRRALTACGVEAIVTISDSIRLVDDCVWVDALEFQRLPAARTIEALQRTIELYRGPFLDGFAIPEDAFDEWMVNERTRLRQLAIDACAELLTLLEAADDLPAAIRVATRLLELEPLQEEVHRRLMVLYWRNGQVRSALNQYEVCARRLRQAFAAEPSPSTVALYREWLLKYNRSDRPGDRPGRPQQGQ